MKYCSSSVRGGVGLAVLLLVPSASGTGVDVHGSQGTNGARETEVKFSGASGLELVGSLTLPESQKMGGFPALLLLPGSGPTDRDGNQLPHIKTDLLKQVAERLATEGYATLRFDKRSARTYFGQLLFKTVDQQNEFLSWENFLGDAKAALEFLRGQEGIDSSRIGLLGHSEGGLIALQMAHDLQEEASPHVLILIGTAGNTLADVLRYQIERAITSYPEERRTEFMAQLNRAIEQVIEAGTAPKDLPKGLRALFPPNATKLLKVELATDPAELARDYGGPVLILNGEKDIQVPAPEHPKLLEKALLAREKEAGSCELFIVPRASHNLKEVEHDAQPGFSGEVVPAALDKLCQWLARNLA